MKVLLDELFDPQVVTRLLANELLIVLIEMTVGRTERKSGAASSFKMGDEPRVYG
jgi:hypothetical protein